MLQKIVKTLNVVYRFTSSTRFGKEVGNMQKAYVRHVDGAEQFEVTFHFRDELKGIDRAFNFCRRVSEGVDVFLARVGANLENVLNKKKKRKKSTNEESLAVDIKVQLLENGKPVSGDVSCKDVFFNNSEVLLDVMGISYSVVVNAPWVMSLNLPNSIMAGFPVYPSKFRIIFAEKRDCGFRWFKNDKDDEKVKREGESWLEVGTGYFYTPLVGDIGHKLKVICTPKRDVELGPTFEVVSSNSVEAGPGMCPFDRRHLFTQEHVSAESFRVVSYNILADLYADSDVAHTQLYPYCVPYALDIDYRKQLILKELLGYHSDIICLQEVDAKVFDQDLVPVLSSVGYEGVFNRKGGTVNEGLAVLFHKSRFKLIDSQNMLFSEEIKTNAVFSDIWKRIEANEVLAERFLARNTCVQCAVLESADGAGECVVVGNTHCYFHPDADHIRLLQGGMAILYLQDIYAKVCSLSEGKRVSLVFCGDFNSTPDCGIYQLMTTQFVPEDYPDWKSKPDEEVRGLSLSHSLQLQSACGTPEFTNFTAGFYGCLDYIFYQCDQLDVTQVVPLPTREEVTQHTALPSIVCPSDHIALVADLKWRRPRSSTGPGSCA